MTQEMVYGKHWSLHANSKDVASTLRYISDLTSCVEFVRKMPGETLLVKSSRNVSIGDHPLAMWCEDGSLHYAGIYAGIENSCFLFIV